MKDYFIYYDNGVIRYVRAADLISAAKYTHGFCGAEITKIELITDLEKEIFMMGNENFEVVENED